MFYENARAACYKRGTSLSTVLKELKRSTGVMGAWKKGSPPKLDILTEMADYLGITIDELVFGEDHFKKYLPETESSSLTQEQQEWLNILDGIPEEKRDLCKDFLRTHMVVPEKHADSKMA